MKLRSVTIKTAGEQKGKVLFSGSREDIPDAYKAQVALIDASVCGNGAPAAGIGRRYEGYGIGCFIYYLWKMKVE